MNFSEFRDTIISLVASRLSSDVTVTHRQILKNNDQLKDALIIREGDSDIAPTIYLDHFYDKYQRGEAVEDLADELVEAYNNADMPICPDAHGFSDFENVRDRIVFRLISKKKNSELLSDMPHYCYLDLAIVFSCVVDSGEDTLASFLIHTSHMEAWKVTRGELFELAKENTPRLFPPVIKPIVDIITELAPDIAEIGELKGVTLEGPAFYVLTNEKKLNGASAVLYENVLGDFANKIESDLYVIPSSVHETLLLPVNGASSQDSLNDIIKDGNRSLVTPEEILSDHFYYFNRKANALSM